MSKYINVKDYFEKNIKDIQELLALWLTQHFESYFFENWWSSSVLDKLTSSQKLYIRNNNITNLNQLNLSFLIPVFKENCILFKSRDFISNEYIESINKLQILYANASNGDLCNIDNITTKKYIHDIKEFFLLFGASTDKIQELNVFLDDMQNIDAKALEEHISDSNCNIAVSAATKKLFAVGDVVKLKSDNSRIGVIISVIPLKDDNQYFVFMDNKTQTFYSDQIELELSSTKGVSVSVEALRNAITIYNLKNPASEQLYSLNSARIDFVPYQFRPALKIIKSDKPRILIADSVGVGKTIEAGIILHELKARNKDFESVLIICPKPLVAEHKWKSEMKRFDEDFTELDGSQLKLAIKDFDLDGDWPLIHKKTIIPFSLLNDDLVNGKNGLYSLNPDIKFDLVIVDEAHHIRHSETQAYKAVKYFCDNANAVVMLTATPIQTSEEDLFTILNLLRPDVVLDKETFGLMLEPNQEINNAIKALRNNTSNWKEKVFEHLYSAANTCWGKSYIKKNPVYARILDKLNDPSSSTRETQLLIVREIESLHSFANMINRTRRQDIQDFCIRRTTTLEANFTDEQQELYNSILEFESEILKYLHPGTPLEFMMNMLMRQASSCVFGLAPMIDNIINRRFDDLASDCIEDLDFEFETSQIDFNSFNYQFTHLATKIKSITNNLPEFDEKYNCLVRVLKEKSHQSNNKVIIFSAFRHTLNYLETKLKIDGFRAYQINGSTKDCDRRKLRKYFELEKNHPDAIDVLLFSEVGSEGLDYQFCNMMINYDLPWNPMVIEQRIGRIDRRGQKSDTVSIVNIITKGTIDAKVYSRCLNRIGIFENSIGECSSILGNITKEIHNILLNPSLTESERDLKLEKMSDNEIAKLQELQTLEAEQRELFGFDLTNYVMDQNVANAENPWISSMCLEYTIIEYLNSVLGKGVYILGDKGQKSLRLSRDNRSLLLEKLKSSNIKRSASYEQWRKYLKGDESIVPITFDQNVAEQNRKSMFITPVHPLIRMAVDNNLSDNILLSAISISRENILLQQGNYPYLIVKWDFSGVKTESKLMFISNSNIVMNDFYHILDFASNETVDMSKFEDSWKELESLVRDKWKRALMQHVEENSELCDFKKTAYEKSFETQHQSLELQLNDTKDEKLIRMRQSQIKRIENEYQLKMLEFDKMYKEADIQTSTIIKGVIIVK